MSGGSVKLHCTLTFFVKIHVHSISHNIKLAKCTGLLFYLYFEDNIFAIQYKLFLFSIVWPNIYTNALVNLTRYVQVEK